MTEESFGLGLEVTARNYATGQTVFARYKLIRIIGRGGMGVVWLARDEKLEREVALKFLPDVLVHDRGLLHELKRETRRSLELTHRHIVRIYDFVEDETSGCISMEYVDGDTLSNLRAEKEQRVFEPDEIAAWTAQLCDALDYAHNNARIIHRDLKPANLMVNQRGELKISDFGIARSLGDTVSRLTLERGRSGTLVYMSPQQLDGERGTHLDDIYSLGATLYDLLTGKPPFYSGNLDRQIHERVAPSMTERRKDLNIEPASVPAIWEETVAARLAKDPTQRPQSTAEVAQRLQLSSAPPRMVTAVSATRRKQRLVLGATVVLLIVAALIGAYLVKRQSKPGTGMAKAPQLQDAAIPEKGIAVLPFENLSADAENAAFAGGVHREVLSNLGKVNDLKVISRTSVMQYTAGAARNLKEIARELGVSHVVEGSVQRAGARVRVIAQLIDATTDSQMWAETFDRELSDIFAIQSEIAQKITDQLGAHLSVKERNALTSAPTQNVEAFDLYTKARGLMETDPADPAYAENFSKAVELLKTAVARDPQFAVAYSALSEANTQLYRDGRQENCAAAEAALKEARRIAPKAGETYFAEALIHYYCENDFNRALATLELAARSLPNDSEIFTLRGLLERRLGRWDESLRHLTQAIELNPKDPFPYGHAAGNAWAMRRYDESRRIADAAIAAFPAEADGWHAWKGFLALGADADIEGAREQLKQIRNRNSKDSLEFEFYLPYVERNYAEAEQALAALEKGKKSHSFNIAEYEASWAVATKRAGEKRELWLPILAQAAEEIRKRPNDCYPQLKASALLNAALGNKEEAIGLARRAVELFPVNQDAFIGPEMLETLALVYAWTGEKDLAFEILFRLVKMPHGGVHAGELKIDPSWDNLRGDPRFAELVAEAAKPL